MDHKVFMRNLIKECVCEIRFELQNEVDVSDFLFKKILDIKELKDQNFKLSTTSLKDTPINIIKNSPQMKYFPLMAYKNENYTIGFCYNSIFIDKKNEYTNFTEFFNFIKKIFNNITSEENKDISMLIKNFTDLRLKYVNIFEDSLFEVTNLRLSYTKSDFNKSDSLSLKIKKNIDDSSAIDIILSNNAQIQNVETKEKLKASVVDLDSVCNLRKLKCSDFSDSRIFDCITNLHKIIYDEFSALLNQEYATKKLEGKE